MVALGLSCNVSSGRITARGVVVDGGVATEVFHHRTVASDDVALQLRTLADALVTRLADLGATAVVVRGPDHHSAARITAGSALRLRAEGVLLATARSRVATVECFSGREIGEACGQSKAEVQDRAKALLAPASADATAAALAAVSLAQAD